MLFGLFERKDIRIEYVAVIPIDIIIKLDIDTFIEEDIIFSIMESLEKNPDMNGIPIRAILLIPNILSVIGEFLKFSPIIRISWYEDSWIMIPAHRNMADLNSAWIIRCMKAKIIEFMEIANIIMAICLNVDRAMIFLRSCSQLADILA